MSSNPVFNVIQWMKDNESDLKPPVGNKMVYKDADWIVMAVGGPNARKDYHHHERGPEFFYQVKGDIILKVMEDDGNGSKAPKDIHIKEGEMYLMPADTIHSPQRGPNTWGIVLEAHPKEGQKDSLKWFCENCNNQLAKLTFDLNNIVTELPPLFDKFYNSDMTKCDKCGTNMEKPTL